MAILIALALAATPYPQPGDERAQTTGALQIRPKRNPPQTPAPDKYQGLTVEEWLAVYVAEY